MTRLFTRTDCFGRPIKRDATEPLNVTSECLNLQATTRSPTSLLYSPVQVQIFFNTLIYQYH